MRFQDLLTINAVFQLRHPITDIPLGVEITLAPDESPSHKSFVRNQMLNFPADLTDEERADAAKLTEYVETIDNIERAILGNRIVKITGFEEDVDFVEFAKKLPIEYVNQIRDFLAERKNFFR